MNYQNNFNPILRRIVDASTPFIHISGVRPQAWCRVIKDTKDKRVGPWRFIAAFSALDDQTWKRKGEVLYFVMSSSGQLKLVGQSSCNLNSRWRKSPMFDVNTKASMGCHSLFHTTAWGEIEEGFIRQPDETYTVSAVFQPKLEQVCHALGGPLTDVSQRPRTRTHGLAYNVETWVCSLAEHGPYLWNKDKNPAHPSKRR